MTNSTPGRPPPGKEYDTMNDDMKIPDGLTCSDCGFYQKCVSFGIASAKEEGSTTCDWSPSRFFIGTQKLIDTLRAQLAEKDAEIKRLVEELEVFNDTLANNEEYCASMSQALSRAQAEIKRLQEALTGLGYTPSADDSGSYDSLIPDEYL